MICSINAGYNLNNALFAKRLVHMKDDAIAGYLTSISSLVLIWKIHYLSTRCSSFEFYEWRIFYKTLVFRYRVIRNTKGLGVLRFENYAEPPFIYCHLFLFLNMLKNISSTIWNT